MYFNLDKRCQEILQRIMYAGGYLKIQDIAQEMHVSRRSVYYDISKINEWLQEQGIDTLVAERNKGISISHQQVQQIQDVFAHMEDMIYHVFTPEERMHIIICAIIVRSKPLYIEDFMEICQVSRNTIINDLKSVTSFLDLYTLELIYDMKEGYRIRGDSIKKRAVYFMLFPSLWNYEKRKIIQIGDDERMHEIWHTLKDIEKKLHVEFTSGVLPTLALFISCVEHRNDVLDFHDMDKEEIVSTKEYALVQEYFPQLKADEKIYITLHLLGSRLQTIPMNIMNEQGETYFYAQDLVNEFERLSCIYFNRREELIQAINAHLKTSLYRYKYGIQLGNPLLDSIKTEYDELFELTRKSCSRLENEMGCLISDAEVAYLTLHFGAFLNSNQRKTNQNSLKIAIICPNGIGTGNMLRSEVASLVPQATEIRNIPLSQYNEDHNYDVVISTVVLPKERKLIVVHPILTDQDRVMILRKCMASEPAENMQIQEIVRLASRYIKGEKLDAFQQDLHEYYSKLQIPSVPSRNYGKQLYSYLGNDHIQIYTEHYDWKEAIQLSCQPLLNAGSIDSQYIDAILSDQEQKGLSMFLADGLVLAHAAIDKGVHHLDVALTTFQQPVIFPNGQKAQIIIALCAEDQTKHIRILKDVLDIFFKKKNKDHLISLSDPKEVYAYLKEITNHEIA